MMHLLFLLPLTYAGILGYFNYKSNLVISKILDIDADGYPYVSSIRRFENT